MLPALLVVFIVILFGWGVISTVTAPKSLSKRRDRGSDGGSPIAYADSGSGNDGGCDGGGGGGD